MDKNTSHPTEGRSSAPSAKIFVVCDQKDTAPVWGYILRQQGMVVILETSPERAVDHWSHEISDLVVLDVDVPHAERMEIYNKFRALSAAPILFFLPVHHETQIMEAYAAGVDDVVVKPISPPIFLAKILAWIRRSWTMPMEGLAQVKAGNYRLDPARRCVIDSEGVEIKLTSLEFRLLHVLMSRPAQVFSAESIIESIWDGYEKGDQVLLKNLVYRLRKKIETDPRRPALLQTWNGGYSFHNGP